jgi:hypothetical protein
VIRVGSLLSTPPGLGLLLLAALAAQIVGTLLLASVNVANLSANPEISPPPYPQRVLLWLMGVYALWMWTWILARPFSGARGTWGGRPWPLPALPLGFRGRLLAEAVAALVLVPAAGLLMVAPVAAWAAPFLPGGGVVRSFVRAVLQVLFAHPEGAVWYAAVLGSLGLPVVLAWLAPIREDGPYYGRSFLVAALVGLGVLWIPGPFLFRAVVSGLGLSALIVATQGLTLTPTFRRESPSAGDLSRPALDPEARFRRDRWERLRRPALRYGVPAACLLVASLGFLGLADVKPGFHLLVVLAAVGLLAGVYKRPVGIDLFATDRSARSPSLFSGAYARAWSLLPLHPETVRRSVYLHGFVSAALVWLLFFAYTRLAHALGLSFGSWHRDLPLALAVPCAAGLLLCGAVGDSVRGTLSALGLFSLPLAHVFSLVLASGTLDLAAATALNWGVLLALAIVGGVPPLVHLRAAGGRHA